MFLTGAIAADAKHKLPLLIWRSAKVICSWTYPVRKRFSARGCLPFCSLMASVPPGFTRPVKNSFVHIDISNGDLKQPYHANLLSVGHEILKEQSHIIPSKTIVLNYVNCRQAFTNVLLVSFFFIQL